MIGEKLQAYTKSGREQPWEEHRMSADKLGTSYEKVNPKKAEAMKNCANIITRDKFADGSEKFYAYFCHVRLCPICMWRRSVKIGAQVSKIVDAIHEDRGKPYRYIFLTLTMRNCTGDELSDQITHMLGAFNRLSKYDKFQKAIKGYVRSMEITYNEKEDTYHPHVHVLLAVNPSYFTGKTYINHNQWMQLWRKSLKINYDPVVNIKPVKGNTAGIIAEITKYTVKAENYIDLKDFDLSVKVLRVLDSALHKRRFLSFGGVFKEYHKKLNLSDPEDDFEDKPEEEVPIDRAHFQWFPEVSQYRQIDISMKVLQSRFVTVNST